MKIIHLSDLHYGQPGATIANAAVLNHIANRPDVGELVVVDTGDTVDDPTESHYRTATSAQIQLAKRCKALLKTPGNHDVDRMGITPTKKGPILWSKHVRDLVGKEPFYPVLHNIQGIAIILVDTNRAPNTLPSHIRATGLVGSKQIAKVAELVRMSRAMELPTIIAMHHCPSGGSPLLRLGDRHAFGEAIEEAGGVDLLLTGHLHQRCEWSHVFGARYLLSSPKTQDAQGYREIWWDRGVDRFRWEWVDVKEKARL